MEERVSHAVDALDETIKEIRSAIFALQTRRDIRRPSLRGQILEIAEEMTGPLGFAPSLRLGGRLDEQVPAEIGEHMLHALREALSNTARHAGATRVDVSVETGTDLVLLVRDNGTGIKSTTRRSGLANLAQRAEQHGGTMRVGLVGGGGTELHWRVPLPAAGSPDG